jgi:hypothetical protein
MLRSLQRSSEVGGIAATDRAGRTRTATRQAMRRHGRSYLRLLAPVLRPLPSQHYSTVRLSSGTCEPSVLEHEATAPISAITSTKAPLSQEVILFRTTSIRITHVLSTSYTVNELSCENAHEPQRIFTYWKSRLRRKDHTSQGGALATNPRKLGNMGLMKGKKS